MMYVEQELYAFYSRIILHLCNPNTAARWIDRAVVVSKR